MFRDTRKKRLRNRVIFAALGVAVMTFGIWLNYQSENEESTTEEVIHNVEVKQSESINKDSDNSFENDDTDIENNGTDTTVNPETYLIKEVDGTVKVFLCDERGNQELYLITSIPYELLSESDQQLFKDGVKIGTEDDLGKFLENFDS